MEQNMLAGAGNNTTDFHEVKLASTLGLTNPETIAHLNLEFWL